MLPKFTKDRDKELKYNFMGDEHGIIIAENQTQYLPKLGDYIELQVPHCDPNVNLFDNCFIVKDDVLVDIWNIEARGYG